MLRLPFLPSLAVILFLNFNPNATGTLAQEKEKAAPAPSQPPFPVSILRQSVLSNNYLKPLLELRSHEQEYLGSRFAEPYIESVVLANAYLQLQGKCSGLLVSNW